MSTILPRLGIYGWKEEDENLVFASLLTGDPLLLIGTHGTAKTGMAEKIAQALDVKFVAYDSSKALFEDVLGYPDVKKLQEGTVEYLPSNVTIWDKDFVLIDELNRAAYEMQSKWLELIRSRRIMGNPTSVKWVFSAINPLSYAGTQALDEALVGRFAFFVYPPEVLSMEEEDRIKVAEHINGDDAPSIGFWSEGRSKQTVSREGIQATGKTTGDILRNAAKIFLNLKEEMGGISKFLARFCDLVNKESKGEVKLDGRRLGFMHRNILAARAIELAKAGISNEKAKPFKESAKYTVLSSLPVGINDEGITRDKTLHVVEIVFDLLSEYFDETSDVARIERVYELFTTSNPVRKAQILLSGDISEMAKTKAWNDLVGGDEDLTILAYVAMQVEAVRPGSIPSELIDALGKKISISELSTDCLGKVRGSSIEHIEQIEALLEQPDGLSSLVAISHVCEAIEREDLTPEALRDVEKAIQEDARIFRNLLETEKGGEKHEDSKVAA